MERERLEQLVQLATIVEEHTLWPPAAVSEARERLTNLCGHVPSLEQLAEKTSADQVYGIAARVIEARDREKREMDEEMAVECQKCHLCGGWRDHNDLDYLFGLARMVSSTTNWAGAAGALALNLLTAPLGVIVGALPGTSSRAYIKRVRLVMCATCGNRRKGSFWNNHELKVSQQDCRKHPSWARLETAGYSTFLDQQRLQQFH